ncbi:hypothetical protein Tco_0647526 [Tanacetum coccineum]
MSSDQKTQDCREGEYMNTLYFQSVGIIHETTDLYTLQQNGISERKNKKSLINRTEDIGGLVVPEEVVNQVLVQQPELELHKNNSHRTLKSFGPEFQLYLIEGTRDEVSDQQTYCFNVEDDPKTFDEAMKS